MQNSESPKRILVVDDEPDIVELLADYIEDEGYIVHRAHSGGEAYEIIHHEPIDLVVSDVRMPKMDGVQLLHKIKDLHRPMPKFIFITGFSDLTDMDAQNMGVDLLQKPVDFNKILESIRISFTKGDTNPQPK